jgi:hypothetical protein
MGWKGYMPSTPDLEEKEAPGYYGTLGLFVHSFAHAEGWLFMYLCRVAEVDEDTARAIFSGVRVHDPVSFIKRIAEVRNEPLSNEFDEALSQLLIINDVRNHILHHSMHQETIGGKTTRIISNRHRALTPDRRREMLVSEDILGNLCDDLETITNFLVRECFRLLPGETADLNDEMSQAPMSAWLYKPVSQSTKKARARPSRRAKRGLPDEPSRE